MSVTTTTYTFAGNSKLLTISQEIGSTNIILAVDSAITGLGWSLYDTQGTTTYNPILTKVYRVLNADGVTYKYLIIRWDTIKLRFYTSCCESWNTSTKTPTNESWTQAGAFAQGYDPQNSLIIVSATARHCMIWTFINGTPGLWTAVVEFERVAAEDLATVATSPTPCFAWTNSVMIGTPYGRTENTGNTTSQIMFAFPRTFEGNVGPSAAFSYAPVTNKGMMPYFNPYSAVTIANDTNNLHLGSYFKNLTYRWDTTGLKVPISPLSVDHVTRSMPFGRIYNFGVFRPLGSPGDTVYANVDVVGGWPSSNTTTSTSTECFLLPMNGGYEPTQIGGANQAYGSYTYPGTLSYQLGIVNSASTQTYAGKVIAIGDNMWFNTSDGIRTVGISGGTGALSVVRYTNTSGCTDFVFDGQRTIYAAHNNGIVKIDTQTYQVTGNITGATFPALQTNGAGYLGIDNKNVYMTSRQNQTLPVLYILDQATFTMNASVCFGNTSNPTNATGFATPMPDYTGNVFAITTSGGGTTGTVTQAAFKFNSNTGAINAFNNSNTPGPSSPTYPGVGWYYDYITNRLWCFAITAGTTASHHVTEHWASNLTLASSQVTATQAGMNNSAGGSFQPRMVLAAVTDFRGDLAITPFRGIFLVGIKTPGGTNTGPFAIPSSAWSLLPPSGTGTNTIGTTVPLNIAVGYATIAAGAQQGLGYNINQMSGGLTTDCNRLFGSYNLGGTSSLYNSVYLITGLYGVVGTQATATSRLLLRG
jgi:hypothetical protein